LIEFLEKSSIEKVLVDLLEKGHKVKK